MKDGEPIGKLIYDKSPYSVYEVDGEEHQVLATALISPIHL
jgi:hypothetical protein